MSNSYAGINPAMQARVRPMFEVYSLKEEDGEFPRTVIGYDKKHDKASGKTFNKRVVKTVMETGGYMVYFPRGHSIRVRNMEELQRLGFQQQAGFVDMETGETMPMQQLSLRDMSQRRTALPSTVRSLPGNQLESVGQDE